MELKHYKWKFIQDALSLKAEVKFVNLSTYSTQPNFDIQEFSLRYFDLCSSPLHVPPLEDFWTDCQDDIEVKKI